jgi:hypothetical protein
VNSGQGLPSPVAAGTPANGALRARTRARASGSGGGERGATVRALLESAAGRVAKDRTEIRQFLQAGQARQALSVATDALRREMADEARRRPGEALALYRGVALDLLTLAERLPAAELEPGDLADGGDFR